MMAFSWTNDELLMNKELRKVGMRIGVVVNEPWAYECGLKDVNDQQTCQYPGIGIEMARSLCTMLAIPCEYIRLNYSTSTTKDSTGVDTYKLDYQEWLKAEIIGGDIDTTLPVVVETNSNLDRQLLDFTLPLFYMDAGLLVRKSITPPGQLMMKPFSLSVWITIAAFILFATAYDIFCRVLIARTRRKRDPNISNSFLVNFGIITGRSVDVDVELWSRRVMYAVTGMMSIVIAGSYSAFLVSTRVSTNVYIPFSTLDQLADALAAGRYRLLVDQYSSHIFTMVDSSPLPTFVRLKEIFSQPGKKPELVANMSQKIAEIGRSSENVVLYSSQFVLRASAKGNCNITIIPLTELSDRGSFAFRKRNYPYSSLFFKATLSFKDKGDFYEQTELKYRFSRPCSPNAGVAGANGVDLASLDELFYFVLVGLLGASIIFGLELLCCCGRPKQPGKSSEREIAKSASDFAYIPWYIQQLQNEKQQMSVGHVNHNSNGRANLEDSFKSFWVFRSADKWYVPDERIARQRRSSTVRQRKRTGSF